MYETLLKLHSWNRWTVLSLGTLAFFFALKNFLTTPAKLTPVTFGLARGFVWSIDLQFLVGLILYFVFSPYLRVLAQGNPGWMKIKVNRYWALEHEVTNFLVWIGAHVGWVMVKKSKGERFKLLTTFITTGIAVLLLALTLPWPTQEYGRPLFRKLGANLTQN